MAKSKKTNRQIIAQKTHHRKCRRHRQYTAHERFILYKESENTPLKEAYGWSLVNKRLSLNCWVYRYLATRV